MRFSRIDVAVLLLAVFSMCSGARATWSIVAVDRETGEIGIAGASCTRNVQGIGEIEPGVGAVVVQAMSNDEAREHGMEMLREGKGAGEIVAAMRDARFDPEQQQYAVLVVGEDGGVEMYTGDETYGWCGGVVGDGVSVQGNILVGEAVVADALAAFEASEGEVLATRLVRALEAGAAAGGDSRCGEQAARSAFVTVYREGDSARTPAFHLVVYGIEEEGEPAVAKLAAVYGELEGMGKAHETTRMYVSP